MKVFMKMWKPESNAMVPHLGRAGIYPYYGSKNLLEENVAVLSHVWGNGSNLLPKISNLLLLASMQL